MADRKARAAASAATAEPKPIEKVDSKDTITKDEGGATATSKTIGNIRKTTVQGINLGKRLITGRKGKKDPINYKKLAKELSNEEFIQEVEDKKDSKAKKVIDIMKGKNSVKINPDMKEDTVVIQDASGKDSVEIVDIISPQKVRSDWRKEINVTEASAAWQRKEGKSKSGGLNEKGRKSYERQNPGSDLKAPSKKVGNKRRASFCARMKGMKKKLTSAKTARDPNSRINKSLRAWNC
jgi:acyl carrier protein